ncbi:MAG: hypothetical protein G01um101416_723 [Microgenomates group bacterium Gr01-1014_16]|nr:MAG: hypothetical protein G01um101416_723 [Microgenomates group bacterium Gr01-1014_16]
MSKIHLEILDKPRQIIFSKLSGFKNFGYLAGGTALALQIQHRKSVDFDVFINKPVNNYLRLKAKTVFPASVFYVNTTDQISFTTPENINVTFFWYIYPPLLSPTTTPSISLASVNDIVADKAYTIGKRAVWRDYVDLFLILKKEIVTLNQIIRLAKQKFTGEFNEALFLEQLSYFKDLTIVPMDFIGPSPSPPEIQSYLETQVESYIKIILP